MTRAMGAQMRRIHVGNALSAFGLGFTVPFLYVYVAQVRDLGAVTAGLVLAAFAVAALIVLPFSGRAIDRRGPLPVLIVALLSAAVGAMSLGLSSSPELVLLSAGLLGAGQAVMQPALATMIVECSTQETRTRAFAMQFFLQNLGLGVGGLIGGQIVKHERASDFTLLFAIETAIFLVLIAVMLTARMPRSARIADATPQARGTMKDVFRNRTMVQLCVLGFVLFFACYGQFESGLSAYGVEAAGISPSTLGIALAANTGAIVIAQFAVLRFVERRKRSRVIATVGLIWAVAWIAAGYAGMGHGSQAMATAAFISTYALFGIGETMLAPTVAPLVADLAPESMVGRYNSAFALVKQLALAVGPAVGGPMGATLHAPYIVTFLLFSLGISVLALRLGKRLTPAQNHPYKERSRVVAQGSPTEPVAANS
ncbi:MDR family MFS transporter [Streptomyces sp. NPDC059009]|uniref:MDR family MFS transporter n=1 Tax=Streptomyces sp. NPDC059009 TaxID=3346694 RepID=UPI003696A1D4